MFETSFIDHFLDDFLIFCCVLVTKDTPKVCLAPVVPMNDIVFNIIVFLD